MTESIYPFDNKTNYDLAALKALNDLAEKTVRKEKSKRTRTLCYVIGAACLVGGALVYNIQSTIASLLLLYGVLLLWVGISWKNWQLRSTKSQLKRGMNVCVYEFDDEEIICNTEAVVNRYSYEQVEAVVANQHYYAIFFDKNNGIIIDRKGFTEGDDMFFKSFIGQHTKIPVQDV